jgi:hypothetical protein
MGHTLEPSLVDKVLKGAKTLCETNGGNGWKADYRASFQPPV